MTTIDIYNEINHLSDINDVEKLIEKEVANLFMYFNNIDKLPGMEKTLIKSKNNKVKFTYLRNLLISEVKRPKLSIDSLSDLRRIILADKSLITLIPFVSRPQIEEKLCKVLNQNLSNMTFKLTPQTQNYCGIVISGRSGTRKTHIEFEIDKIAKCNKAIKKLKDHMNATFEHIYISIDEIKSLLRLELDNDVNNKYSQILENINKASIFLKKLIVIYFLVQI
ncbi:11653_t:CDS:2 [Funneliformis caledonium]|uniref:11653_t:CDS:1 n=1 Tax=Funneliformis caledonium TaxID=1117310 RepID=A0A9N9C185_9GLOM|nr:11653_t:CDS:2 [Funneliformis caledonium]